MRHLKRWAFTSALFPAGLTLFRHLYFGELLPLTYFSKVGGAVEERLMSGLRYSADFFSTLIAPSLTQPSARQWTAIAGALVCTLLLAYGLARSKTRIISLVLMAIALPIMYVGGDWMMMSRFWIPALPFLFVLVALMVREISPYLRLSLLPALSLVMLLSIPWIHWGRTQRLAPQGLLHPSRPEYAVYHKISLFVRSHCSPGDTVALMDVGQIGYETGLRIIDISGLITPWVAKSPGGFLSKIYPVGQLLAYTPRFILLRPAFFIDRRIYQDPIFRRDYQLVGAWQLVLGDLLAYERRSR